MANRLTRYDPFTDLARFDPLRGVEDLFREFALRPGMRELAAPPGIRLDVDETEHSYEVKAEMPGLKKEEVKVEVTDGRLAISGERKREEEETKEQFYRCEREYGSFYRAVPLPEGVKLEDVKATFADGVLEVSVPLPAKPEATVRTVEIQEAPKATKAAA